jgi:hypothetical protein
VRREEGRTSFTAPVGVTAVRREEGGASFTVPVGITALGRDEAGASFTVPVGVSTAVRARGKLEPERRAAPSPATIPSGDRLRYS